MSDFDENSTRPDREPGRDDGNWEKRVIEKLVFSALAEQRRSRRWGIFFKSLTFVYLIFLLAAVMAPMTDKSIEGGDTPLTAVVDVSGVIADGEEASAEHIIKGLRRAFENKATAGVILRMNTPGGSPVQSAYVYDEIIRLKQQHKDLPIYAVVADICASGGYYIASAVDKIYVNKSSMIGSIGVLMNGFGFVEAIEKLGVERRLLTAGKHKGLLDPFSPVTAEEKGHVEGLLKDVHQTFIDAVKEGRGSRLSENPDLFSGLVWTGTQGISLGLADGLGSVESVARDIIGVERVVNFTPQEKLLDRLVSQVQATTDLFKTISGVMTAGGVH